MGRGEPGSRGDRFEGNFEKASSTLSKFLFALAQPVAEGSPEQAPRAGAARLSIRAEGSEGQHLLRAGPVGIRLPSAR